MMSEKRANKCKSCNNMTGKEEPKVETASTIQQKDNSFTFACSGFLRKFQCRSKANAKRMEKDYSAFGNVTAYEKKVIDRLRADGLADVEIGKCLREL